MLFGVGTCPAVSVERSVSRVGAKSLDVMWRLVAFRLYMLMNEYRHELESVVKSKLFKVRSHRCDRVYVTFVQRSPLYSYYNMFIVFACVHGYLDSILLRLVKFLEYTLMVYDVVVVSQLLRSSYNMLY